MAYGLKASSCDPLKLISHQNRTNLLHETIAETDRSSITTVSMQHPKMDRHDRFT